MSAPQISVLIPAYNAARTVGATIESVLNQTLPAHEIIVVDDGSADDTPAVAARFGAPVRLIRQANSGPAAARNHAARLASCEWLALLDSDDRWLPNKLERQAVYLTDEKISVVHCRAENHRAEVPTGSLNFERLWQRNCLVTSSVLLRREAFLQAGGFDEDRALIGVEDYNLWLRLAANGRAFAYCPETLVCYTPAPGNLSGQTERFAAAELANVDALSRCLALAPELLRQKRLAIHAQYGRDLLYYRQQKAARKMLAVPLRERPTLMHFGWWLATFAPSALLDWRRKRRLSAELPLSSHGI